MIIDSYNRVHDYLRISLTDNCNLRCFYCMPDEDYDFAAAASLMQPAEIEALAKIFVEQGVKKNPPHGRRTPGKKRCRCHH